MVSRSPFLEKAFASEIACYVVHENNGNILRFGKKLLFARIEALHCI